METGSGYMDTHALDDPTLLKQIATAASTAALAELYDRYGRLIYSLAFRILGDTNLAEEITQDVFVQVWNKASTYRVEQGKVVSWLASMARYRSIDVFRRQNVRPEGHQMDWGDDELADLAESTALDELVELRQQQHRLYTAIRQLPGEQRSVLALAYFKGYSHQEIADELAEPLGTVKTRLRLAMQKLRQMLAGEGVVPPRE